MTLDLFAARSVLFLPASNPRAIARARDSAADLVILDLEDAVKAEAKEQARAAAAEAVSSEWRMPVGIRINGIGSDWHSLDIDSVSQSGAAFAVVPRTISARLAAGLREALGKPLLAMIETAAGVLSAAEIAGEVAGLIAGTNDLSADLRLPPDAGREPLQTALQTIVLAARAAGVAAFDGVHNRLDDVDGFAAECQQGRKLGFDGKTLIHPDQIGPCNSIFSPAEAEVERAKRLVDAFEGGAGRLDNEMIERMHVESARRLLQRSREL